VAELNIELLPRDRGAMLPMARLYNRSAYDAATLTLAQQAGEALVTVDKRLYNAVKGKPDWVVWRGDYLKE
jgi:predicted nucleic acid-binding protein